MLYVNQAMSIVHDLCILKIFCSKLIVNLHIIHDLDEKRFYLHHLDEKCDLDNANPIHYVYKL